ncbi:MAG: HD domain-containing protein [Jiangellaceae bacterium]
MDELLTRWIALVCASPGAEAAGRDLLARWSQPHRHYHAVAHLRAVLDAIDELITEAHDADNVRLAAWFHDAVYDGRPGDDERASADLARDVLGRLGLAPARVEEIARLVLLTADHDPAPGDPSGAVLCDADLAVLGGSPEDYAAYAAAVRSDYAHIDDAVFRTGRVAVLEALLAADPLFRTQVGRARWEATARRNLSTELALLELQ